jgi:hypothetical protein
MHTRSCAYLHIATVWHQSADEGVQAFLVVNQLCPSSQILLDDIDMRSIMLCEL